MVAARSWLVLWAAADLALAGPTFLSKGGGAEAGELEAELAEVAWPAGKAEHELSIAEYIEALNTLPLGQPAGDDAVGHVRERILTYLERVAESIVDTIVKKDLGFVADCVPFLLQPALLDASAAERAAAAEANDRAAAARGLGEVQAELCPGESVALPRYRLALLFGPHRHVFEKAGRPAARPRENSSSVDVAVSERFAGPAGYTYDVTSDHDVPGGTSYVGVTVQVGQSYDPAPVTAPGSGHVLNQMWWTGHASNNALISLEAGWIQCSYFTSSMSISLFAFSSPDGYNSDCGSKADSYNYAGDFVQFSGAPSIGVPLNLVQAWITWQVADFGYQLGMTPFNIGDDGSLNFQKYIPLGYYAKSHFCHGINSLDSFRVGLELNVGTQTGFRAGGGIYGWDVGGTAFPVCGAFQSDPEKEGWVAQCQSQGTKKTSSVVFGGDYTQLPCINDLSVDC